MTTERAQVVEQVRSFGTRLEDIRETLQTMKVDVTKRKVRPPTVRIRARVRATGVFGIR